MLDIVRNPKPTSKNKTQNPLIPMSEHKAVIRWQRASPDFLKGRYSREHTWTFDGGLVVPASPSPSAVPAPYSIPANVDPEEAFVAAIAAVAMLTLANAGAEEALILAAQVSSRAMSRIQDAGREAIQEIGKTKEGAAKTRPEELARDVVRIGQRYKNKLADELWLINTYLL
jgi:organic hydroperoxide reductase OsmC/OhrA